MTYDYWVLTFIQTRFAKHLDWLASFGDFVGCCGVIDAVAVASWAGGVGAVKLAAIGSGIGDECHRHRGEPLTGIFLVNGQNRLGVRWHCEFAHLY